MSAMAIELDSGRVQGNCYLPILNNAPLSYFMNVINPLVCFIPDYSCIRNVINLIK